jgi:hypothetical protein
MYRDFGVGQMGDMGAHTMDLVWNAIDAGGAAGTVEVDHEVSDKFDPDICPVKLKATFEHPEQFLARTRQGGVVSGRAEAGCGESAIRRASSIIPNKDRQRRDLRRHEGQHRPLRRLHHAA